MTHSTLLTCSLDELDERLRRIVREEMQIHLDRPVSTAEVAKLHGVSVGTVKNWDRKEYIKRVNKGGHPVYSYNEVMNFKRK